jgi:hypothetical protein
LPILGVIISPRKIAEMICISKGPTFRLDCGSRAS